MTIQQPQQHNIVRPLSPDTWKWVYASVVMEVGTCKLSWKWVYASVVMEVGVCKCCHGSGYMQVLSWKWVYASVVMEVGTWKWVYGSGYMQVLSCNMEGNRRTHSVYLP